MVTRTTGSARCTAATPSAATTTSMWCDPAYNKLIKEAKVVTYRDQRTVLYKQAQQYLKQQVPITPVAHSTATTSR